MSTLTIRKLDALTHTRLRKRAAQNEHSVEAEVRAILDDAVGVPKENFLVALRKEITQAGGVDLEIPPRTDEPRAVDFG